VLYTCYNILQLQGLASLCDHRVSATNAKYCLCGISYRSAAGQLYNDSNKIT